MMWIISLLVILLSSGQMAMVFWEIEKFSDNFTARYRGNWPGGNYRGGPVGFFTNLPRGAENFVAGRSEIGLDTINIETGLLLLR